MCFNVHHLEWVGINTEANFVFVFFFLLNVVLSCVGFSALICWGLSSPTLHGRLLSQDTSTISCFLCLDGKHEVNVSHSWKYEKCESKKIWSQGNSDFDEMAYREFEDSSGQGSPLSPLLLRFLFFVCFSLFPVSRLNRCRFLQFNFPIVPCAGHTPFLFL